MFPVACFTKEVNQSLGKTIEFHLQFRWTWVNFLIIKEGYYHLPLSKSLSKELGG